MKRTTSNTLFIIIGACIGFIVAKSLLLNLEETGIFLAIKEGLLGSDVSWRAVEGYIRIRGANALFSLIFKLLIGFIGGGLLTKVLLTGTSFNRIIKNEKSDSNEKGMKPALNKITRLSASSYADSVQQTPKMIYLVLGYTASALVLLQGIALSNDPAGNISLRDYITHDNNSFLFYLFVNILPMLLMVTGLVAVITMIQKKYKFLRFMAYLAAITPLVFLLIVKEYNGITGPVSILARVIPLVGWLGIIPFMKNIDHFLPALTLFLLPTLISRSLIKTRYSSSIPKQQHQQTNQFDKMRSSYSENSDINQEETRKLTAEVFGIDRHEYRAQEKIDEILDKFNKTGFLSLTDKEQMRLLQKKKCPKCANEVKKGLQSCPACNYVFLS